MLVDGDDFGRNACVAVRLEGTFRRVLESILKGKPVTVGLQVNKLGFARRFQLGGRLFKIGAGRHVLPHFKGRFFRRALLDKVFDRHDFFPGMCPVSAPAFQDGTQNFLLALVPIALLALLSQELQHIHQELLLVGHFGTFKHANAKGISKRRHFGTPGRIASLASQQFRFENLEETDGAFTNFPNVILNVRAGIDDVGMRTDGAIEKATLFQLSLNAHENEFELHVLLLQRICADGQQCIFLIVFKHSKSSSRFGGDLRIGQRRRPHRFQICNPLEQDGILDRVITRIENGVMGKPFHFNGSSILHA